MTTHAGSRGGHQVMDAFRIAGEEQGLQNAPVRAADDPVPNCDRPFVVHRHSRWLVSRTDATRAASRGDFARSGSFCKRDSAASRASVMSSRSVDRAARKMLL